MCYIAHIGILLSSTKSKQLCLLDYQIMVENRSMMTSEVYECMTVEMNNCEVEYEESEKLFDLRL
ncbi:hypothetical protein T4B_13263 [Trichinella pseudospiralis]|uniref:Uncharacterized protein n=1 Tax=Trichinella pseudospiralis TaxID=6337 RepID=A0A0V1IDA0_TRIPS|nr:hypothetical protein T4A_2152 [Trichinella pseudospiralis]KRZ20811.1 hypothetical protein T4B_13263 [Trichinella pseudospiralis]KRZ30243.1 hypothetical protein T4C_8314 [Trichinella pseudospiralis]